MLTLGELLAGRYELQEVIGFGGMSQVYRARDRELDRTVAIKVLRERTANDEEWVARFEREARTAAGLSHENIVSVIDRGDEDGRSFIVYEYAAGRTLKQLVQAEGPLPVARALSLVVQLAHALAYAHAHGYIHRDVKPQNVLVDSSDRAKLTDFGIAHSLEQTTDGLTLTGTVLGSADYIAPEQAQAGTVDEHTDIYSLGVVLYELLSGALPFGGDNFVAVALKHVNETPPPVSERRPEIPARVEETIRRALAKSPDERFPTMDAFARELEACLREPNRDDTRTTARVAAPPSLSASPTRFKKRWARPAGVFLILGTGALVTLFALGSNHGGRGGTPKAAAAITAAVPLRAVAAYDPPPGDGVEDNQRLPLATDGDPSTAWTTEWYASPRFGNLKRGVGIILDARKPVALRSLTIESDTPGFTCVIKAADAISGPFRSVSAQETVGRRTTLTLRGSRQSRYYLVWITSLAPGTAPHYRADINNLTAFAAPSSR